MKKLINFVLAVVSTTFLFVGATQAAEEFDTIGRSATPTLSESVADGPTTPCIWPE